MLAETLHRPVYEIERDMPLAEFVEWQDYFEVKEEERKRQEKEAERNAGKRK